MKNRIKIALSITICSFSILLISVIYIVYTVTNPKNGNTADLSDCNYFIAHATGSLEGYTYLNCKESLLSSLEKGYKYIEIDLQQTADGELVCVHDWEQFNKMTIPNLCEQDSNIYMRIPSLKEFCKRKIYKKYSPLTLKDLILIRKTNPFIIVTDIICNSETLNRYFEKKTRNNVMVEAFSEKDYHELKKNGYTPMLSIGCVRHFDCISFIISHLYKNDIEWITVEQHSSIRSLRLIKKLFNIKIALYTVNSPRFFKWHLGKDIDLIYTDNWDPQKQLNTYQDNTTH